MVISTTHVMMDDMWKFHEDIYINKMIKKH